MASEGTGGGDTRQAIVAYSLSDEDVLQQEAMIMAFVRKKPRCDRDLRDVLVCSADEFASVVSRKPGLLGKKNLAEYRLCFTGSLVNSSTGRPNVARDMLTEHNISLGVNGLTNFLAYWNGLDLQIGDVVGFLVVLYKPVSPEKQGKVVVLVWTQRPTIWSFVNLCVDGRPDLFAPLVYDLLSHAQLSVDNTEWVKVCSVGRVYHCMPQNKDIVIGVVPAVDALRQSTVHTKVLLNIKQATLTSDIIGKGSAAQEFRMTRMPWSVPLRLQRTPAVASTIQSVCGTKTLRVYTKEVCDAQDTGIPVVTKPVSGSTASRAEPIRVPHAPSSAHTSGHTFDELYDQFGAFTQQVLAILSKGAQPLTHSFGGGHSSGPEATPEPEPEPEPAKPEPAKPEPAKPEPKAEVAQAAVAATWAAVCTRMTENLVSYKDVPNTTTSGLVGGHLAAIATVDVVVEHVAATLSKTPFTVANEHNVRPIFAAYVACLIRYIDAGVKICRTSSDVTVVAAAYANLRVVFATLVGWKSTYPAESGTTARVPDVDVLPPMTSETIGALLRVRSSMKCDYVMPADHKAMYAGDGTYAVSDVYAYVMQFAVNLEQMWTGFGAMCVPSGLSAYVKTTAGGHSPPHMKAIGVQLLTWMSNNLTAVTVETVDAAIKIRVPLVNAAILAALNFTASDAVSIFDRVPASLRLMHAAYASNTTPFLLNVRASAQPDLLSGTAMGEKISHIKRVADAQKAVVEEQIKAFTAGTGLGAAARALGNACDALRHSVKTEFGETPATGKYADVYNSIPTIAATWVDRVDAGSGKRDVYAADEGCKTWASGTVTVKTAEQVFDKWNDDDLRIRFTSPGPSQCEYWGPRNLFADVAASLQFVSNYISVVHCGGINALITTLRKAMCTKDTASTAPLDPKYIHMVLHTTNTDGSGVRKLAPGMDAEMPKAELSSDAVAKRTTDCLPGFDELQTRYIVPRGEDDAISFANQGTLKAILYFDEAVRNDLKGLGHPKSGVPFALGILHQPAMGIVDAETAVLILLLPEPGRTGAISYYAGNFDGKTPETQVPQAVAAFLQNPGRKRTFYGRESNMPKFNVFGEGMTAILTRMRVLSDDAARIGGTDDTMKANLRKQIVDALKPPGTS